MFNKVKSRFKQNEKFSYRETPKHFNSVTEKSIRRLKGYCLRMIRRKYKEMSPGALQAMLGAINGEFDIAYAVLEGDYSTRYNNLQDAYSEGLADLQEQLLLFEQEVIEHNVKLDEYSTALQKVTNNKPDVKLYYDEERVKKFQKQYEELKSKVSGLKDK